MLALQRTAGNRAVGAVLGHRSSARAIQRDPMLHDWSKPLPIRQAIPRGFEITWETSTRHPRTIDAAKLNYCALDDWVKIAKHHPDEVDKTLLRQAKALRDAQRPARDATVAIEAFEDGNDLLAFDVDRRDVGRHLRTVIQHPELIGQGSYGICGPDAFLRAIALRTSCCCPATSRQRPRALWRGRASRR